MTNFYYLETNHFTNYRFIVRRPCQSRSEFLRVMERFKADRAFHTEEIFIRCIRRKWPEMLAILNRPRNAMQDDWGAENWVNIEAYERANAPTNR